MSNANDSIKDKFSKYNFFTSRFFSAVDFDYTVYNCDPIIIMISDPLAIDHTVIDPATEAIQIIGRFRNPEVKDGEPAIAVIKDIYHITNYISKLISLSNEDISGILTDIQWMHRMVASFKPNSNYQFISKFKHNILKVDGFSYFNRDSSRNHFMIDNFRDKELINSYYNTSFGLLTKYKDLERFDVDSESNYKKFILTDSELREMTTSTGLSKLNIFVGQRLKELMEKDTNIDMEYLSFNLDMLRISYPKQMAVIDDYGIDKAAKLGYDINKIQDTKSKVIIESDLKAMKAYVKTTFELRGYLSEDITEILSTGIMETGLKGYKPKLRLLKKLAQVSKRTTVTKADGTQGKGYKVISFNDKAFQK